MKPRVYELSPEEVRQVLGVIESYGVNEVEVENLASFLDDMIESPKERLEYARRLLNEGNVDKAVLVVGDGTGTLIVKIENVAEIRVFVREYEKLMRALGLRGGDRVKLIAQGGAEAKIYEADFEEVFGVPLLKERVIVKHRIPKRYRIKEIDVKLRKERTVREARILHRAKEFGVNCPYVYEVDLRDMKLVMEYIEGGQRLKELLESVPMEKRLELCREVGRQIGKLHKAGIVHGDLTTSNMIFRNGKVYLIDFGLADFDSTLEARGGVDLHLLRRAMESTHYTWFERGGFEAVLEGYAEVLGEEARKEVEEKMREIESRGGRYRERSWFG